MCCVSGGCVYTDGSTTDFPSYAPGSKANKKGNKRELGATTAAQLTIEKLEEGYKSEDDDMWIFNNADKRDSPRSDDDVFEVEQVDASGGHSKSFNDGRPQPSMLSKSSKVTGPNEKTIEYNDDVENIKKSVVESKISVK